MATYPRTSNRSVPSCRSLLLVLLLTLLGLFGGCSASTPTITRGLKGTISEFPLPAPNSQPLSITAGPDGNLWFTEITSDAQSATAFTGKIGRITPAGQIREFPLPARNSPSGAITAGPDGNLWFTETISINNVQSGEVKLVGKIGRITPAGQIREFPLPAPDSLPNGITTGPDGALWFTEDAGQSGKIGRITPSGTISEFPLPATTYNLGRPFSITTGPDGALWFTETITIINVQSGEAKLVGQIGRITPTGQLREFPLTTPESQPISITAGPDGALWFIELVATAQSGKVVNKIGRITLAGQLREFLSAPGSYPVGITAGPDGALWFTELVATAQSGKVVNKIGRITPAGQIREFPLSAPDSVPMSITTGPDGALWFTELQSGKIGGKIGRLA